MTSSSKKSAFSYRIGIDLGTTSISAAIIRLDPVSKAPIAVVKSGVRIFPDGREDKTKTSKAVKRREARSSRRMRSRFKRRKALLLSKLISHGFYPPDLKICKELIKLDPIELRAKAASSSVTPTEFGRVLIHINQKRGFKSNRTLDLSNNESGAIASSVSRVKKELEDKGFRTPGEFLADLYKKGLSTKSKLVKVGNDTYYSIYFDRKSIEEEFEYLWEVQKRFDPKLYSDSAKKEIKDAIFYQRPLKSCEDLVGRCTLLPSEKRAPISLISTQLFNLHQILNNHKITYKNGESVRFNPDQKDLLLELLISKNKLTYSEIKSLLELEGDPKFNFENKKGSFISGSKSGSILSIYLGKDFLKLYSIESLDELINKAMKIEYEEDLLLYLNEKWPLLQNKKEFCKEVFVSGYASLSSKIIYQLIDKMKGPDMPLYNKAVESLGLNHSSFKIEKRDFLPYYGEVLQRHVSFGDPDSNNPEVKYGKIGNPTVHVALNQLRAVVNDIIKKYGPPEEINVEVTRDLKISKEKANKLKKAKNANEERNRDLLNKYAGGMAESLSANQKKNLLVLLRLYDELKEKVCPYSGKTISVADLFNGNIEIDHIIPFAISLDDTFNNKVLCFSDFNRAKGKRAPGDFLGSDEKAYLRMVQFAYKNYDVSKAEKFTKEYAANLASKEKDFLARALNDTAYISKIAREYLSSVCNENKIRALPGRITGLLRAKYGLNSTIKDSSVKDRSDHRHHAIDAIVVGITDPHLLSKIQKAASSEKRVDKLLEELEMPFPNFREHVCRSIENTYISYKPDIGFQGQIHEETARRVESIEEVGGSFKYNLAVRSFDKKENKRITKKDKFSNVFLVKLGEKGKFAYKLGSNYCIDVVLNPKTKKWVEELVTTKDAYDFVRKNSEEKLYEEKNSVLTGSPLVLRIRALDCFKLKDGSIIVVKSVSNGRITFKDYKQNGPLTVSRNKSVSEFRKIVKEKLNISPAGLYINVKKID